MSLRRNADMFILNKSLKKKQKANVATVITYYFHQGFRLLFECPFVFGQIVQSRVSKFWHIVSHVTFWKLEYTGCATTNRRCWFWITDTRLKIIQFCFLLTDVAHLGFCLRLKSSISDHWSSHRVQERPGGLFEKKK